MEKKTVKQLESEILKMRQELSDLMRDFKYVKKDIAKNNEFTIKDLEKAFNERVYKIYLLTSTRKPALVEAHKIGGAIIRELKSLN